MIYYYYYIAKKNQISVTVSGVEYLTDLLLRCFPLRAIHVSGMEDLLLYIASSDDERQLCMHILEIVSLMFREQVRLISFFFL